MLKKDQIKKLLELLQSRPSLVKDIPEEELILRSLNKKQIKTLARPRKYLLCNNRPIPARIQRLITTNMKNPCYEKIINKKLAEFRPRSVSYDQGKRVRRASSYETLRKEDYCTKQVFSRNQQETVANTTIEHLFSRAQWSNN